MDTHDHLPTWMLFTRDGWVSRDRMLAERHRYELRLASTREASLAARLVARLRAAGKADEPMSAGASVTPACCPA
jgi:hypothetical protein